MAKVKELISVEEKLRRLYHLQLIDSKIDEIKTLQGELPIEVKDLEDEIEGLGVRIGNLDDEIAQYNTYINNNKTAILEAETLIKRYSEQQMNVKNNREYDALSKEIEMQHLEIELSNKKIRDTRREIGMKDLYLQDATKKRESRKADLVVKKKELKEITEQTKKDEVALGKKSKEASKLVEKRLLIAYNRVRNNYRNGLAVVTFSRDSCGGCFGKIPPQVQLEIGQRKKMILCEHCGRILVDPKFDEEIDINE
ncbi:MAG: zinc ribbon domain-containing protein [Chitinophagales bacterium]